MDPDQKMKNEIIAARDRTMDVVNTKWDLLARIREKPNSEGLQLAVLNGIGVEVARYHDLLGVLPDPEDLFLTNMYKAMEQEMKDMAHKEKVKKIEELTSPPTPQPWKQRGHSDSSVAP